MSSVFFFTYKIVFHFPNDFPITKKVFIISLTANMAIKLYLKLGVIFVFILPITIVTEILEKEAKL